MKKIILKSSLVLIASTLSLIASPYDVGIRLNSLGVQLEFGHRLTNNFSVRLQGGGYHHFKKTFNFEDVEYQNVRVRPVNVNFLVDWYFYKTGRDYGFRISPGVGYNNNRVELEKDLSATGNFLGKANTYYTGDQIKIFKARYSFRRITPMAVIGYDSPTLFGKNCFLSVDVGAYFQGRAKAKAKATGTAKDDPTFQRDAREEATSLLNKHAWVKTYPIVSIALKYQF